MEHLGATLLVDLLDWLFVWLLLLGLALALWTCRTDRPGKPKDR